MLSEAIRPGPAALEPFVTRLCGLIDELKGDETVALDMRGMCDFADAFVIATARSRAHMQGVALQLVERLRQEGQRPFAKPDLSSNHWVVVDYGNVVVHLFDAESRAYYALEQLWGDAPALDWQPAAMA